MIIWVETDEPTRLARDVVRIEAGEASAAGYVRWMAEENAYTTHERPWEHADLLVSGGDSIAHEPRHPSRPRRRRVAVSTAERALITPTPLSVSHAAWDKHPLPRLQPG